MKRNKTKTNTASFLIRYVQQYRLIVSAAKCYLLRIAAYVHMYVIKTAKGFFWSRKPLYKTGLSC